LISDVYISLSLIPSLHWRENYSNPLSLKGEGWGVGEIKENTLSLEGRGSG